MSKFKEGQKVYVRKLGRWAIVKTVKAFEKYLIKDELGNTLYVEAKELENFIEPKYKVGDIILAFPGINKHDQHAEIVKCVLNKVRETYYYVAYCTDGSAYALLQEENQVVLVKTKCPKCGSKI